MILGIKEKFFNKQIIGLFCSLASGLIAGAAMCYQESWWLIFFAFVPLLWSLRDSDCWERFFKALLAGLAYTALTIIWLWEVLPVEWLGFENIWSAAVLVGAVWFFLALVLALPLGLWGVFVSIPEKPRFSFVVSLAVMWVLAEVAGSLLYSLFSYGSGTVIGAHFTVSYVGYALAESMWLSQLSWWGGVYLLSFFVLFINGLVFLIFLHLTSNNYKIQKDTILKTIVSLLVFSFLISSSLYTKDSAESTKIRVGAIQINEPPTLANGNGRIYRMNQSVMPFIKQGVQQQLDLVVLPEGVRFFDNANSGLKKEMQSAGSSTLIIDSTIREVSDGKRFLSVAYRDTSGNLLAHYDKRFLMPFVEYIPLFSKQILLKTFNPENIDDIFEANSFDSGDSNQLETDITTEINLQVATRLCSEILSPHIYQKAVKDGAEILVNQSSHSVFHYSKTLAMQSLRTAQIRAVELDRWLVLSGNGVPAYLIDNKGELVQAGVVGQDGVLIGEVQIRQTQSPYVFLGW